MLSTQRRVVGRERPLMSTNVKCCFKLRLATSKMLIIISSPLRRLCLLCRRSLFCTAAMQVFSPVSLVLALHMIKTWNYKNQTGTTVFIKIPTETDHTPENGNRHSTNVSVKRGI